MYRKMAIVTTMLVLLAACGDEPVDQPAEDPAEAGGRVAVDGMVIARDGDTRICHTVMESYPPQCGGGLHVEGLDLEALPEAETASGVTFGHARLVGDLDGDTLHVTDDPAPSQDTSAPADPPTRQLDADERADLVRRYREDVDPLLAEHPDAWLSAHPDEEGGYIRVMVVDDRGPLAQRLRDEFGDDVDVHGWVTHLD